MNFRKFSVVVGLFILVFFSCTTSEATADEFATTSTDQIATETRSGGRGCYEIVYPVTVVFPDESTLEVASHDEMKAAFKAWREKNAGVEGRPKLQFPFSVTNADGVMTLVENEEQLKALRAECRGNSGDDGHGKGGDKGKGCFTINFPYSLQIGDNTVAVNSKEELKAAIKQAREAKVKPQVVFPVTVTLKDGTTQTVKSAEELKAIKEACRK